MVVDGSRLVGELKGQPRRENRRQPFPLATVSASAILMFSSVSANRWSFMASSARAVRITGTECGRKR